MRRAIRVAGLLALLLPMPERPLPPTRREGSDASSALYRARASAATPVDFALSLRAAEFCRTLFVLASVAAVLCCVAPVTAEMAGSMPLARSSASSSALFDSTCACVFKTVASAPLRCSSSSFSISGVS